MPSSASWEGMPWDPWCIKNPLGRGVCPTAAARCAMEQRGSPEDIAGDGLVQCFQLVWSQADGRVSDVQSAARAAVSEMEAVLAANTEQKCLRKERKHLRTVAAAAAAAEG